MYIYILESHAVVAFNITPVFMYCAVFINLNNSICVFMNFHSH